MRASLIVVLLVADARADEDLVKRGLEEYRAGNFAAAAKTLGKAYELDHKSDTLFALAQAERQSGDCKAAVPHYRTVIQQIPDLNVARLVQQSLSLCGEEKPDTPEQPSAPPSSTKTVYRTDTLAVTSLVIGGLAVGAGGGLLLSADANREAGQTARTLDDYHAFRDRAATEQTIGLISAGAGVALVGYAIYRFVSAPAAKQDVAVVPTARGLVVRF